MRLFKKKKEATVVGFQVLINSEGNVVTEMSGIPEQDLHKAFKGEELEIMRSIIRLAKPKLQEMHKFLEDELCALNHAKG